MTPPREEEHEGDIVEQLRRDVFHGDERAHRFGQHNPMHMEAANEIERLRKDKDAAYEERNRVVAALTSIFPAGIARTDIPGWLPEWHGCVYIDLPTGQASWHYHDSQAHLFVHLPLYTKPWDGHTTDQKYRRLDELTVLNAMGPPPSAVDREGMVERYAQIIYEAEPYYESGEYVDGFQVSPGGHLSWEQAKARDAEFGDDPLFLKITDSAYKVARAVLAKVAGQ